MSLRGVKQLKKLLIHYSDIDGSSRGVRSWMGTNLIEFAKYNPDLEIVTEMKRAQHPYVRGYYANGNTKTIGIKNLPITEINEQVFHLRNQIGRKMNSTGYKQPVVTETPSLQGEWHETMDLVDLKLTVVQK